MTSLTGRTAPPFTGRTAPPFTGRTAPPFTGSAGPTTRRRPATAGPGTALVGRAGRPPWPTSLTAGTTTSTAALVPVGITVPTIGV